MNNAMETERSTPSWLKLAGSKTWVAALAFGVLPPLHAAEMSCEEAAQRVTWSKCVNNPVGSKDRPEWCDTAAARVKQCNATSSTTKPAAQTRLLVNANFENANYKAYGWRTDGNEPRISNGSEPTCRGQYSLKVELDRSWDESYRTEITGVKVGDSQNLVLGKDYWIGFAIYLPKDWATDKKNEDILLQLHGSPDKGEPYRNPPLALTVDGDQWKVDYKADTNAITKTDAKGKPIYTKSGALQLGTIQKGRWTQFVMHFKVSPKSDGFLDVWMNGSKKSYKGGIFFNDAKGPFLKTGIYKPAWRPDANWDTSSSIKHRKHFFDELKIADGAGSYDAVKPNCK